MLAGLLDEIDSLKASIDEQKPASEPVLKQLREYYKIGLTYTSNALEGNSLSLSETKIIIEDGLTIGGKPLRDHLEVLGHSEAYDFMFSLVKKEGVSFEDILTLHRFFYYRIDTSHAGVLREDKVFISGSAYSCPAPEELSELMHEFISGLEGLRNDNHPVVYAARVHKEFVFIHPFVDGNGRVARLLMNIALQQQGYNLSIIPPILRREYIESLEKAHVDDKQFLLFVAQQVKESQKDYLRLIS